MAHSFPLLAVRHLDRTSETFRRAIVTGALARGYDPNAIAAVMAFESGFDPRAVNPHSGARGLIQWLRRSWEASALRAGLPVPFERVTELDAMAQLPAVFAYLDGLPKLRALGAAAKPTDYYLAVFYPRAVGEPDDFVIAREGKRAYDDNSALDQNSDGQLTAGDVRRYFQHNVVDPALGRAAVAVPLVLAGSPSSPSEPSDGCSPSEASSARTFGALPPERAPEPPAPSSASSRPFDEPPPWIGRFRSYELIHMPELHRGSKGLPVFLLQTLLDLWGDRDPSAGSPTPLTRDGAFGSQTHDRLVHYQLATGSRDELGVCGEDTWQSFGKSLPAEAA